MTESGPTIAPTIAPTCHDHAQAPGTPIVLGLRPKDAARALGIGTRLLWSLTNSGVIPHVRLTGKCIIYPVAALEAFLAAKVKEDKP